MSGKIVIVEGIDGIGKTTLCRKLESAGFVYFKDYWNIPLLVSSRKDYLIGKVDTALNTIKAIAESGRNVVVDRFHLTECVYSKYIREEDAQAVFEVMDKKLRQLDALLMLLVPSEEYANYTEYSDEEIAEHNEEFLRLLSQSSIQDKIKFHFAPGINSKKYTKMIDLIIKATFKYDIYLAAPFFSAEQQEREERVKETLRAKGFTVFSPKENCFLPPNANDEDRQRVFRENYEGIDNSSAVLAITDGKDIGTIWESGYAYAKNKPLIYLAETLGNNPFNLMLAQSCNAIYKHSNEINREDVLEIIRGGHIKTHEGLIE